MILSIGEILIDVFPDYQRIGGAPFNFAYHMKKMGFPVRFISRIGMDGVGNRIVSFAADAGFDSSDFQIDRQHPTGRVDVKLDDVGVPHFAIATDVAYDFIDFDNLIDERDGLSPQLVYFGSLIQRTKRGYQNLQTFLTKLPRETFRFYDMNLRPGCFDEELITRSLAAADIIKINEEELQTASKIVGCGNTEVDTVRDMKKQFGLKIVAVTKGSKGSALYTDDGLYEIEAPDTKIVDTVGAGDAYCAALAAGVLSGWDPEKMVSKANIFSAHICGIQGAVPSTDKIYADFNKRM